FRIAGPPGSMCSLVIHAVELSVCGIERSMALRGRICAAALAAGGAVLCIGIWFSARVNTEMQVATAVVSHTLCSGVFISHLDPEQLYADAILPDPGQAKLAKRLRFIIDRKSPQVTVNWAVH